MYIVEINPALKWMHNVPHRVMYSLESDANEFAKRMKDTKNIQYVVSKSRFIVDGADYYQLGQPERDASIVEYSYHPKL